MSFYANVSENVLNVFLIKIPSPEDFSWIFYYSWIQNIAIIAHFDKKNIKKFFVMPDEHLKVHIFLIDHYWFKEEIVNGKLSFMQAAHRLSK